MYLLAAVSSAVLATLYRLKTASPQYPSVPADDHQAGRSTEGGVNLYMKQHRSREPPLAPVSFLGGMPLKEIKTKPENGKPRLLDSAAKAPKTAMKDAWLKSKEKAVSELKGTPFASQQGETSNAPANSAGDQMLSGIETTAKKSANITYRGGKKTGADHPLGKSKKKEKFPVPSRKRKTLAAKQRRSRRIPLLKYGPKIPLPRRSKENLKKQ